MRERRQKLLFQATRALSVLSGGLLSQEQIVALALDSFSSSVAGIERHRRAPDQRSEQHGQGHREKGGAESRIVQIHPLAQDFMNDRLEPFALAPSVR